MKLLIAEDEPKTGFYLQQGLTEAGYCVDRVITGTDAVRYVLDKSYDLLILDVMMPGLNGWEVLSEIRAAEKSIPVIFLTARDSVEDRVKGLDLGADDYMVKPFAFSELLSRVRALLRRAHPAALKKDIKIADLEIDLIKHKVTRGSKQIDLTAKEFSLLEFMLKHRGEILPKSLISSQVWGMSFESGTNVIEVAVSRLRAKIDDGFEIKLIHTSRGMGYVIDVL